MCNGLRVQRLKLSVDVMTNEWKTTKSGMPYKREDGCTITAPPNKVLCLPTVSLLRILDIVKPSWIWELKARASITRNVDSFNLENWNAKFMQMSDKAFTVSYRQRRNGMLGEDDILELKKELQRQGINDASVQFLKLCIEDHELGELCLGYELPSKVNSDEFYSKNDKEWFLSFYGEMADDDQLKSRCGYTNFNQEDPVETPLDSLRRHNNEMITNAGFKPFVLNLRFMINKAQLLIPKRRRFGHQPIIDVSERAHSLTYAFSPQEITAHLKHAVFNDISLLKTYTHDTFNRLVLSKIE